MDGVQTDHCYRHPSRATLLSCSSCGKSICSDCMTNAAVGIRCPDCAKSSQKVIRARGGSWGAHSNTVTIVLVALCAILFVASMLGGAVDGFRPRGDLFERGALFGPLVADGEWWRLLTAGFLHADILHIAFNMMMLWVLGDALERYTGPVRFLTIYLSAVLWGSAGALVVDRLNGETSVTVGASGGVFGLMAALLVMQWTQGTTLLGGQVGMLLLVNLGISFVVPGISIGGHLGGLVGGALAAFVLGGFGKGHVAYGKLTPVVGAGIVAVMAGAVAVSLGVV